MRSTYDDPQLLPPSRIEELELHGDRLRAAADHVALLTEGQMIALHPRMFGTKLGSITDNTWP